MPHSPDLLDAALAAAVPPARDGHHQPTDAVPSVSLAIRVDGVSVYAGAAGWARLGPDPVAATPNTVYDLASVTKSLAGATVAAAQVDRGQLDLDAPVREVLPDVDRRITAWHLLSHSAGYPAWSPLYEAAPKPWGTPSARRAVLDAARLTPLVAPPGEGHVYSDLGYLVLLELLEAIGGAPLDAQLHRALAPAGLADALTWGHPAAAATERCPTRGRLIQGEVHDLNAASMGGVSTHAGLFGTAHAVAEVADSLRAAAAGERDDLPGRALRLLWTRRGAGSHRGGWDGVSAGYTSTGAHFPPDAVGHLGYTGTSVWVAPSRRTTVALLTNRVHPDDGHKAAIRALRPHLHDAVARWLRWA